MSESIRKRKDLDYRAFIRRIILISVSSVVVLAVALFNYFLPFSSFLPATSVPARKEGELRIHFLSVGQGDATVVEFPNGECILIDAGNGSYENNQKIYQYLKGLDISDLSLIATHADIDHTGGMQYIISKFGASKLYLPAFGSDNSFYTDMLHAAAERGCATDKLSRYDAISNASGAYIVCISPYSIEEESDNDFSTVLYLKYGETSVLLGADISSTRERRLMREYALDEMLFDSGTYEVRLDETDILKVSHHGSGSSSCEDWLTFLGAEVAVISCGADNTYGHPNGAAISRLTEYVGEIYRTDELGDIMITIDEQGYTIHTSSR